MTDSTKVKTTPDFFKGIKWAQAQGDKTEFTMPELYNAYMENTPGSPEEALQFAEENMFEKIFHSDFTDYLECTFYGVVQSILGDEYPSSEFEYDLNSVEYNVHEAITDLLREFSEFIAGVNSVTEATD